MKKGSSMLLDVQYIKANKRKNIMSDYLYIIWKDLDTNQKHLNVIREPQIQIYFEKPEFRNHTYNKNYARLNEVDPFVCKYKDVIYAIADDMGDRGREHITNCFNTQNYRGLQELYTYPYVYGADYDIRVFYRHEWKRKFDTDRPKPLTKGYLDIEVDMMEADGSPSPEINPVDLITFIDDSANISYTFMLVGVVGPEKDVSQYGQTDKRRVDELEKRKMYQQRKEQQYHYAYHVDELEKAAHEMFDENYPDMEYKFFLYEDEAKMITHLFQLINKLKLDFIEIWNISFDIPYLMERLKVLGYDPAEIMCHPDFPVKECRFKKDTHNFEIKNKSDYFFCSSYTIFTDQMRNYAATRKGQSELRSNKLTYIAQVEVNDEKLDYSEVTSLRRLSCTDYLKYTLYNIKDVLLQLGIERKTTDLESYYITSYANITPYEHVFKQTVKLRNVQYKSFFSQGLIPGENINGFLNNYAEEDEKDDEDDEGFEGALVGNPKLINNFGMKLFGKRTNSIFNYSVDFDMSAFYPSTIRAMNIDPSTLIFKMILPSDQYDVRGGDIPFHGITDVQLVKTNNDSFSGDVSKEVMDNFQTGNYITFGHKWLNLPSINEYYKKIQEVVKGKKKLRKDDI